VTLRVLPATPTMPARPPQGFGDKVLDEYLRNLANALVEDRGKVGDRIERRIMYGPTTDFPTARGGSDLYFDTTVGDLYIDTGTWELVFSTILSHNHDDRYFTETESDNRFAPLSHTHDDRYYTESEVTTFLAGKSDVGHTHDSRYYTESEVNSLLAGKSDVGHTHDDRYFTETESDNRYLPLTAGSGKPLTGDLYLTNKSVFLSNTYALKGYYSGAYYDLVKMLSTGIVEVGSTSRKTQFKSSTFFEFNTDVVVTGGLTLTGGVDMQNGSNMDIRFGPGGELYLDDGVGNPLRALWVSSGLRILGDTSGDTWVEGSTLKLYRYGYSGTASPSTTQWSTAGSWGIHVETDAGTVHLVYNDGGTLKKVQLT
jgi:hypothetical protein